MQGCKLSLFDLFSLVLQKVRVGTLNQVLADTFNISQTTVSSVFISLSLFHAWEYLYLAIPGKQIHENMPTCCKFMYLDCRGIIDASEIKVGHHQV